MIATLPRPPFLVLVFVLVLCLGVLCLGVLCVGACGDTGSGEDGPPAEVASGEGSAFVVPEIGSLPEARRRTETTYDHVVLVTIDTWRWDAAGFAGNERASTPTLDRLAEDALRFERAHALNVLTLPSHANILTGMPPFEHGVRDNAGFFLRPPQTTVAERLAGAGIATGAFVAAFPLDSAYGLDQGFDVYDDSFPKGDPSSFTMAERSGEEVVRRGLGWWRERGESRRFLWLHLYEPHTPYSAGPEDLAAVDGDAYLAEVAAADRFLAPVLGPLLDGTDPVADRTLVIVTADHGEALGEHGEATHGLFAYDATLRVPLLLWGGGLEPAVSAEPASHLDLVPTILDALGLPAATELSGRSLLAAAEEPRVSSYFEALNGTLLRGWAPLRGLVDTRWTGERWRAHKVIDLPIPELYDLDSDPGELDNLFAGQSEFAGSLVAELPNESVWPPQAGTVSEAERRALESLGYLSGGGPSEVPTEFTVADDPKNLVELDALIHRYIDHYRRGRLEQATEVARQVVEARPQMGLGHYHLAQALLERGLRREALRVLSDAYRSGATTPSLIRQLGLLLTEAGRHQEAVRVLEPLSGSGDLESLMAYAQAQSGAGSSAQARKTLERVLERDPESARAWETLALVSVQEGEWQRAREEAQRAIDLNPRLGLPWNYLGVARYNLGDAAGALEAWRESLRLVPDDYDVLYNFAIVSAEAGRRQQARSVLERFVTEAPADRYGSDIARARELLERLR